MKKSVFLLLVLSLCMCLIACGQKEVENKENNNESNNVVVEEKKPTNSFMTNEEATVVGNRLYKLAMNAYTNGAIKIDEESKTEIDGNVGYKITNIDELQNIFTENKFEQYVGNTEDTSDNANVIKKSGEDYYRIDADRGNNSFYISTILSARMVTVDRIEFDAISYYCEEDESNLSEEMIKYKNDDPDKFISSAVDSGLSLTEKEDSFIIVKEDDTWKVDEFILPM